MIPTGGSFSPILNNPVNIRPKPNIRTKNPERTTIGIKPKKGNVITIKPRKLKIKAIAIFCISQKLRFFLNHQNFIINIYIHSLILLANFPLI